jgi:lactate permease
MLALHAAGGSAGNGICLNNMLAACAVVALNCGKGNIIAKPSPPAFCFCVITTLVMLAGFFRF